MAQPLLQMLVDVPKGSETAMPVSTGLPLSTADLKNQTTLRLKSPSGQTCPMALRPLTSTPMGAKANPSQWTLLSFLASEPGIYQLESAGKDEGDAAPLPHPVTIHQTDQQTTLDSGRLKITLPAASKKNENDSQNTEENSGGPISEILLDGTPVLSDVKQLQFLVDDASSLHGRIHQIEILEQSPLRAKVRVHGDHRTPTGDVRLTYRLDIDLWAGQSTLRLDYQFFHVQPGLAFEKIQAMRMVFEPQLGGSPQAHFLQRHYDMNMRPRLVENAERVAIDADWERRLPAVADRAMLKDDLTYPPYLECSLQQSADWIGLTATQGGAYLRLADMVDLRPARLTAEHGVITAELWPREAGTLVLPQGKTRRHTITLALVDAQHKPQQPGEIEKALAWPLYEGRATLEPADLRPLDVFDIDLTMAKGGHMRMEQYLLDLTDGVKLGTGLFNHGDGVEAGYSRGYAAIGRQPLRPGVTDDIHPMHPSHPNAICPSSLLRYEPAWANNEYDLIHALAIELMRTGRRSIWPTLKAVARHNIEVDFIYHSDDPWQHHGSPAHSANHVNSSAYPSHLWTQGLLEYYCLTGDPDALEVAIKLGDTIIRNLEHPVRKKDLWGFNREIGWALLSLVQLAEATGLARFYSHAGSVVDYLVNYQREAQGTPIKLSNVDAMDDIHSQMVGSFFGYASMIEAMDRFARITERPDVDQWLDTILKQVLGAAQAMFRQGRNMDSLRRMLPLGMAIGFERTGDRAFLEIGMLSLEIFLHTEIGIQTDGEVKFTAMVHRSLVRFLKHAQEAGLLQKIEYQFASAARPQG